MAAPSVVVVGREGLAPVVAHGCSFGRGGREGGFSPSRCAWALLRSWWSGGGCGQPQSLRMGAPSVVVVPVPVWSGPVVAHGPSLLTAELALCDHVTSRP